MGPQRWREVQELFLRAIELPEDQLEGFLDAACGDDAALRAELESLLRSDRQTLDTVAEAVQPVAIAFAADSVRNAPRSYVGSRIGPYHLIREIGHGGMGTVYHAIRADDQYLGSVAVKVLSHGAATPETVARFRIERQILASLHHANIATLLDGGATDDGRPYIVMEYIEGIPVIDYCRTHNLSVAARIELFLAICGAVHHAHQRLIIHRDIKPANVLVTSDGVPKLLDFGIAKLLDPDLIPGGESLTRTAMRMFTPQYASPEQIRGEPLGTASDVYSLAVLLFEILTHASPYRTTGHSSQELERTVCEKEPARLTSVVGTDARLRRQLSGDLETIVAMALRKEPQRRYGSVQQFADDLERYRKGLPVSARDDTIIYLATKFVRRNKVATLAFLLLALSIGAGGTATIRESQRTAVRYNEVRRLANSLLVDIHQQVQSLPGSTPVREQLARTALEYLDNLSRDYTDDTSLQWELSQAYEMVGDVQGDPAGGSNLGQFQQALASYRRALAMVEQLAQQQRDFPLLSCLTWLHYKCGDLELRLTGPDAAVESYTRGLSVAKAVATEFQSDRAADLLRNGHQRLATAQTRKNDLEAALDNAKLALALAENEVAGGAGPETAGIVPQCRLQIGNVLWRIGDLHGAWSNYEAALDSLERTVAEYPREATLRQMLITAYISAGDLNASESQFHLDRPAEATKFLERALAIAEELASRDVNDAEAQAQLSTALRRLAAVRREAAPAQAAALYRRSISLLAGLLEQTPEDRSHLRDMANARAGLGIAYSRAGSTRQALDELQAALSLQRTLRERDPDRWAVQEDMVDSLLAVGRVHLQRSDGKAALAAFDEALEESRDLLEKNPAAMYSQRCFALAARALGDYHLWASRRGNGSAAIEDARRWYNNSLEVWSRWRSRDLAMPYAASEERRDARQLASLSR